MVAFLYRMPAGIPGNVTRTEHATVESCVLDSTDYPTSFGVPVGIDASSHALRKIKAGDAFSFVKGLYVRSYPMQGSANDALGAVTPPGATVINSVASYLTRGFMTVKCALGTAAKNGRVYVRVGGANGSTKIVGNIEAAAEVSVVAGAITGTGTSSMTASVTEDAVPGTYSVILASTSQTAKCAVVDPGGSRLGDATVGTPYSANGLSFTITAAGTMTAGDSFAPVVTANTIKLPSNTTFIGPADANGNTEIAFNI